METKFNFNSQICTTKEQSIHLLALGLKKETADMWRYKDAYGEKLSPVEEIWDEEAYLKYGTPSWSLGRLIEMLPNPIPISEDLPTFHHYAYIDLSKVSVFYYWEEYNGAEKALVSFCGKGFFSAVVDATEWLIKEGCFNKEYLV